MKIHNYIGLDLIVSTTQRFKQRLGWEIRFLAVSCNLFGGDFDPRGGNRSFPLYYNGNTMYKENLTGILTILRQEMKNLLGEQLEAIYLYGSHARGEATPDSDIDVLVVLHGDFEYPVLLDRTSDLICKLSLENDTVISRVFITKEKFEQANSPFLLNVQREAVPV